MDAVREVTQRPTQKLAPSLKTRLAMLRFFLQELVRLKVIYMYILDMIHSSKLLLFSRGWAPKTVFTSKNKEEKPDWF